MKAHLLSRKSSHSNSTLKIGLGKYAYADSCPSRIKADIQQTEQYAHLADNIGQRVVEVLDLKRDSVHWNGTVTHYTSQHLFDSQKEVILGRKTPENQYVNWPERQFNLLM